MKRRTGPKTTVPRSGPPKRAPTARPPRSVRRPAPRRVERRTVPPSTARRPRPQDVARAMDAGDKSLVDVLDSLLNQGVVLNADLILALANVDLVYVRLSALLCAADRVLPRSDV